MNAKISGENFSTGVYTLDIALYAFAMGFVRGYVAKLLEVI